MVQEIDIWWEAYEDVLADHYKSFIIDEQSAAKIEWFQHSIVPGLLQTEGYAIAISKLKWLPIETQREADASVAIRTKRQWNVMDRKTRPKIHIIIDESMLYRPIGGKGVLYEQLVHLLKVADAKHVTLQTLPINQGGEQYPYGVLCFTIFTPKDAKRRPTLYCDNPPYFSKPVVGVSSLAMYRRAFASLGDLADTPNNSKLRIMRAIEALDNSTGLHAPLAEN